MVMVCGLSVSTYKNYDDRDLVTILREAPPGGPIFRMITARLFPLFSHLFPSSVCVLLVALFDMAGAEKKSIAYRAAQ